LNPTREDIAHGAGGDGLQAYNEEWCNEKKRLMIPTADISQLTEILAQSATHPGVCEALCAEADGVRSQVFGDTVYIRGIIEFSNICRNNCHYCGIRRDNNLGLRRKRRP